jgi:predicted RNase H-like HicB family nuclease
MIVHVVIDQDEEGFYVAEVPAFPGCLSQGTTYEEAIENVKEAIQGWLETMETREPVDASKIIEVAV